jgi:hypothetical protein
MITLQTSIQIEAPIDHVWAILLDFSAYQDWNPYMVHIEGEPQLGATIIVHSVPAPGLEVTAAPVLVIDAAPYKMRWEGGLPDRRKFKGDHWFVLEHVGEATRLRHDEHFSGSLAEMLWTKHGLQIESNFKTFNQALKEKAERA